MPITITSKPVNPSFNASWTGANGAVAPSVYYHIDEGSGTIIKNLRDTATHTGTFVNGPDWVTSGSAVLLEFVNTNSDYIDVSTAWDIDVSSANFTLAVLHALDSLTACYWIGIGDAGNANVFIASRNSSGAQVRYRNTADQLQEAASNVPVGTYRLNWFTWDVAARVMRAYYDDGLSWDAAVLSRTVSGTIFTETIGRIGAEPDSVPASFFDGKIGGVYVWKGTAMSTLQMGDVYNSGSPWPFLTVASNNLAQATDPITAGAQGSYSGTGLQNTAIVFITDGNGTATSSGVVATNSASGSFVAPTVAQFVAGNVKFGGNSIVLKDAGGSLIDSLSISSIPTYPFIAHNVTSLADISSTGCIYFGSAISISDQLAIKTITQSRSWSVSIGTTGLVSVNAGGDNRTDWIVYNVYDETDGLWGNTATLVITTTPELSSFSGVVDGTTSGSIAVTTNIIEGTIYFIAATASTTPTVTQIIAGQDAAGATATWASSLIPDTVNESIKATGLAAGTKYFPFAVQVNLASLTSTLVAYGSGFTTTSAGDITPDQFSFTDVFNVAVGSDVTSNAVTVTGIDVSVTVAISVVGGLYSINSGTFVTTPGSVILNDSVRVKHTASSEFLTNTDTVLTISGVSDTFTSQTTGASLQNVHDIWEWLFEQGYPGGMDKRIRAYLEAAVGISSGHTTKRIYNWLGTLGYTGNLSKRINDFERDNTIQHGPD